MLILSVLSACELREKDNRSKNEAREKPQKTSNERLGVKVSGLR